MYKVIMLPTEGSENEAPAISLAVRLSQRFDAELHLVRVHTVAPTIDPVPVTGLLPRADEALRAERLVAKESLESLGDQCGHFGVVTALVEGPVGPALRDYADRKKIDLIVMSSRSSSHRRAAVTCWVLARLLVPIMIRNPDARIHYQCIRVAGGVRGAIVRKRSTWHRSQRELGDRDEREQAGEATTDFHIRTMPVGED